MELQNPQHDIGGDVVRQIADHVHGFGLGGTKIVQWTGSAADHGREFSGDKVGFEDLHVGFGRIAHAQLRRQHAIEFDSDDASRPWNQQVGENAAARTDLDDGAVGDVAQRFDDAPRCLPVDQEVLS